MGSEGLGRMLRVCSAGPPGSTSARFDAGLLEGAQPNVHGSGSPSTSQCASSTPTTMAASVRPCPSGEDWGKVNGYAGMVSV